MGKKEEEIRKTLEDVLTGRLLEDTIQEILALFPGFDEGDIETSEDVDAIWAKSQQMAMEDAGSEASAAFNTTEFARCRGAGGAYRQVWLRARFGDENAGELLTAERDKEDRETVRKMSDALVGGVVTG